MCLRAYMCIGLKTLIPNAFRAWKKTDLVKTRNKSLLLRVSFLLAHNCNFKVIAKEKNWTCKPWSMVNVGPEGNLVLPCYVRNEYATGVSVFETGIKTAISRFDWKETLNCQKCSLHCYVEPSLVLSWDFRTYVDWAFRVRK